MRVHDMIKCDRCQWTAHPRTGRGASSLQRRVATPRCHPGSLSTDCAGRPAWDGRRALRVGIVSRKLFYTSSVMADFMGIAEQLRARNNVTLVHLGRLKQRRYSSAPSLFVSVSGESWVHRARRAIAAHDFDVLLFLDSTMTTASTTLVHSRLAPVQVTSHGHLVTTGLTARSMDYYVSWAGAELPHSTAAQHYTEKLLLLPASRIHQWFEPINPLCNATQMVCYPGRDADGTHLFQLYLSTPSSL